MALALDALAGSSPRVRGTRPPAPARRDPRRFIPACAGNAYQRSRFSWLQAVHPRVCGERGGGASFQSIVPGSSPRVRGTRRARRASSCRCAVHPRVCGERLLAQAVAGWDHGSSPRVRGTRAHARRAAGRGRFIPACAGNASTAAAATRRAPVHPRVCGERPVGDLLHVRRRGSSPRVRGTPQFPRSTPTPAAVHPRVCGERRWTRWNRQSGPGSSPRVRGTQFETASLGRADRFIPACAGNAPAASGVPSASPVHPRVCGERRICPSLFPTVCGSSPRVRGTPPGGRHAVPAGRFIPACAGNARLAAAGGGRMPVHPRVCGERNPRIGLLLDRGGSSPRVRGTLAHAPRVAGANRFIPACAGNAPCATLRTALPPVHPRVCGERPRAEGVYDAMDGSSPRVRGTPHAALSRNPRRRFIPACAGNAPPVASRPRPDCGSSPRVRGTHRVGLRRGGQGRFIPACAGNARCGCTAPSP